MNIVKKQDEIGLVILGAFEPTKITPKWMYEHNIITHEEWDAQDKNLIVSPPATQFTFGNIIFFSQPSRIQFTSTDIAEAAHISIMAHNVLDAYGETQITAVGVNASLRFTFHSVKDSLRFGEYFCMLEHAKPFMDNPRLRSVTYEDNFMSNAEEPRISINIASVDNETLNVPAERSGEVNQHITVPICTIGINNHFVVKSRDEAHTVVERAERLQAEFRDKCTRIFTEI